MTTESSRTAFEAWAKSDAGGNQSCALIGTHATKRIYVSWKTRDQLEAWQAAMNAAIQWMTKRSETHQYMRECVKLMKKELT